MKKYKLILLTLLVFLLNNCKANKNEKYLDKYKANDKDIINFVSNQNNNSGFYFKNLENAKNGHPIYILRMSTPLFKVKPSDNFEIPEQYLLLNFGDIVFPVKETSPTKYFFLVKTINNEYGWIYNNNGISLNCNEDENLYFFSKAHYLNKYIETSGNTTTSDKIILAKNVVPMLLGNFKTTGWYYPEDYNLALVISKYCTEVAANINTYMYAASNLFDWKINEIIISNNLLADSYHKLKFYDKAEEIHNYLFKRHLWKRAENTPIGGLNSIAKLEKIYLDQLKNEKIGSKEYNELQDKIVDTILIIGNNYNGRTVIDKKWHLTSGEWVINILQKNVTNKEFYTFAKKLKRKTESEGYKDMINLYVAIEMYKEGKEVEAIAMLKKTKPKHSFKNTLRINNWLSANKVIPDSIIFQYHF